MNNYTLKLATWELGRSNTLEMQSLEHYRINPVAEFLLVYAASPPFTRFISLLYILSINSISSSRLLLHKHSRYSIIL